MSLAFLRYENNAITQDLARHDHAGALDGRNVEWFRYRTSCRGGTSPHLDAAVACRIAIGSRCAFGAHEIAARLCF